MTEPGATVRPMAPGEADQVAALHRRAFPDYPSTKLGAGYCRRMLSAYQARADSWVDVAVQPEGRIVGYLVGAPPAAQQAVDRALRPWAVLNAVRTPADLGRNLRRAVHRVTRRLRPPTGGDVTPADEDPTGGALPPPATVRVVLVAVDGPARGIGAADQLLAAFARTARARGHHVADLSVAPDNEAAHRTYRRNGWVGDADGAHFRLVLGDPPAI